MKKSIIFFLMLAAALIVSGCKKKDKTDDADSVELTINTDNNVRNQPVWFLIFDNIVRNDNTNKEKSVWDYSWYHNNLDIYNIWVNFPLYRVEHLFKVKKEQIYQDLELYLWNDNTIDTMKNISNKDKIIQHGYDLKTSFRKEKE